jgi:hypothetical protein
MMKVAVAGALVGLSGVIALCGCQARCSIATTTQNACLDDHQVAVCREDSGLFSGIHEEIYSCPPSHPMCAGAGECFNPAPLKCMEELVFKSVAARTGFLDVGDLNGDGLTDIAYEEGLELWTMLAHGDRTFSPPVKVLPPALAYTWLVELDGDDVLDLLTTDGGSAPQFIAHGHGDGTFSASEPFDKAGSVVPLTAVNDAGPYHAYQEAGIAAAVRTDRISLTSPDIGGPMVFPLRRNGPLAVTGERPSGSFVVQLLSAWDGPNIGTLPGRPRIATDFDEDGNTDVIVNGVLLGNGDGGFGAQDPALPFNARDVLAAGDFDRDGHADLKVLAFETNNTSTITSLSGLGTGRFTSATPSYVLREISAALPVRIDTTGAMDLLVRASAAPGTAVENRILRGNCP